MPRPVRISHKRARAEVDRITLFSGACFFAPPAVVICEAIFVTDRSQGAGNKAGGVGNSGALFASRLYGKVLDVKVLVKPRCFTSGTPAPIPGLILFEDRSTSQYNREHTESAGDPLLGEGDEQNRRNRNHKYRHQQGASPF